MSSILTNMSAMNAVASLSSTQRALATTQSQISTGLKVASAQDNASYWSISTLMQSRIGTIRAINDSLNLTKGLLNVTSVALQNILDATNQIKVDILDAKTSGVGLDKIQQDILTQQNKIKNYANTANFNGENLLNKNWTATASVTENTHYNGNTFISGSGVETYTISDGQGTNYNFNDTFTISNPSDATTDHYTSLGSVGPNPFGRLTVPIASSGSGVQTVDLDVTGLNILGGLTIPIDYIHTPPYYNETVTETVTNDDTMVGTQDGTYVHADARYAYDGRDHVPPYGDDRLSAYTRYGSTHTYVGEGYTDQSSSVQYRPYEEGSSDAFGAPTPLGQDQYTVSPGASLLNLSLTGNNEYNYVQNPDGTHSLQTSPYALTEDDLTSYANMVEANVQQFTSAIATLGSQTKMIEGQQSFNTGLADVLTAGVSSLVDADMNDVSTRLGALQTQQQLGLQSLSIANDDTKQLLKLFGTG